MDQISQKKEISEGMFGAKETPQCMVVLKKVTGPAMVAQEGTLCDKRVCERSGIASQPNLNWLGAVASANWEAGVGL